MAVRKAATNMNSAKRRWLFGANVTVMTVLAASVLVGANWLGHLKNSRWDLTGGISGHRLSQRSKRILDQIADGKTLRITTVYASDNPEASRKEFFPRVEDLCEEIVQYRKSVEVEHVITGNEQAELRDRIQEKFGTAATEYASVVHLAQDVWKELSGLLGPQQQMLADLLAGDSWLGGFTTLANIATVLQKDLKNIEETNREVDDLVRGQGIPRYSEANDKIKQANNELKSHLEQIQNWAREMNKLVEVLGNPDDEFVKTNREKMGQMAERVAALQQIAGDPDDPAVPDDPKPVLQNFAKAALSLSEWLTDESNRIDTFVTQYPAIAQHPKWRIQQAIFTLELPVLLTGAADDLGKNGRELRRILAQGDNVPLDQLQNVVRQLRTITVQVAQNLQRWSDTVLAILDEGTKIDARSKAFLAKVSSGEVLSKPLDRLNEVSTKISELPELKLDEVAKRLQEDNIIVVEEGDKVKVVTFDEAWPVADQIGRMGDDEGPPPRVFDGDSAISNAILAMQSEQPVAKVVLVTFEEQVPPQMRQYQRPMMGPMPVESLRELRTKLEAMHFDVEDWNLAEEGAKDKPPTADEGVPVVYVFLPPPSAPPPMFGRQPQQKQFTPADAEVARQVLSKKNARGLFLAMWMQPTMFGPPPEYGWGSILSDDWGIKVDAPYRVIRGVVDRKRPGYYAIDVVQWWYMQLSSFTEHPIGYPLRARRMLMKDVCPVLKADKVPDNVEIAEVLDVPAGTTDIWAEEDVRRIFVALQRGSQEGSFTRSDQALDPPFSVMLAATKQMEDEATAAEKQEAGATSQPAEAEAASRACSKVVVMGNGLSLRDDFLQQRVVRFGGQGTRLVTDPPPTENLDLFVNALYWLADQPELIAAGPAEVPVVAAIEPSSRRSVWFVTVGWALAALIVGGVMMSVRRK